MTQAKLQGEPGTPSGQFEPKTERIKALLQLGYKINLLN